MPSHRSSVAAPPDMGLSTVLRMVLAFDATVTGGGYLFGPAVWSSSGTLAVVRELGVPVPTWGAAYLIVGVALLVAPRTGFLLGLFVYGFWAACQVLTISDGELEAWGNPWHTGALAALHGVGLWRASAARVAGKQ